MNLLVQYSTFKRTELPSKTICLFFSFFGNFLATFIRKRCQTRSFVIFSMKRCAYLEAADLVSCIYWSHLCNLKWIGFPVFFIHSSKDLIVLLFIKRKSIFQVRKMLCKKILYLYVEWKWDFFHNDTSKK